MVKGGNNLLSEWISYHYTVLPLRYLLVITDADNPENPNSVLEKWTSAKTNLNWWLTNVSLIDNVHGEFSTEKSQHFYRFKHPVGRRQPNNTVALNQYVAHVLLKHKQSAMITYCTNFLKEKDVRWVTLYDTDEFLAINRIGIGEISEHEKSLGKALTTWNATYDAFGSRPNLPPMGSNATVVEIIESFERIQQPLKSCHSVPRVSVGAFENFTCPGSEGTKEFVKANFDYQSLDTLRFQQHAEKENFSKNRYGKVIMDVSNINVKQTPSNVHRPFKQDCPRPFADFKKAPFYLMHYSGDWGKFKAKGDTRRGYEQWKERGGIRDSTSCCQQEIHRWVSRFVDQVGLDRANYLLGTNNSREAI